MDDFNQVIKVPGDFNPDPRGTDKPGMPKGGLPYYQDDLDTSKKDVVSDEIGDDPRRPGPALAQTGDQNSSDANDDLRKEPEDRDKGDKNNH